MFKVYSIFNTFRTRVSHIFILNWVQKLCSWSWVRCNVKTRCCWIISSLPAWVAYAQRWICWGSRRRRMHWSPQWETYFDSRSGKHFEVATHRVRAPLWRAVWQTGKEADSSASRTATRLPRLVLCLWSNLKDFLEGNVSNVNLGPKNFTD